jgi:hypothetical protein
MSCSREHHYDTSGSKRGGDQICCLGKRRNMLTSVEGNEKDNSDMFYSLYIKLCYSKSLVYFQFIILTSKRIARFLVLRSEHTASSQN